jgi:hypothetical protein
MKISIRKFIDMVMIGFKSVEMFKRIISGTSLGLLKKTLNMIDSLMHPILVHDHKHGEHSFSQSF